MNPLQTIARKTIKVSFDLAVSIIEYFSNMEPYHEKVAQLRPLKDGTLGKEIANCLDDHNLSLVPKFESHDLKHVLLDYKMTPEGEIRLQAFMIGNGNYSLASFVIFLFGAVLLPDLWSVFLSDFKKGRKSIPIAQWSIEEYAQYNLNELKKGLAKPIPVRRAIFSLKQITRFGAFASIVAGIFGMLFCLPFLFSSNLADLVGAGFPFVGGAILAVGGLLALSNISRQHKPVPLTN